MVGEDVLYELAARLGSIDTYDRHGRVVLLEDFSSGLARVYPVVAGTGAGVAVAVETAKSGSMSCRMTAGSDGDKYARILVYSSHVVPARVGFEFSWARVLETMIVQCYIEYHAGATLSYAACRYDRPNENFDYLDAEGDWQTLLADHLVHHGDHSFHTMKVVAHLDSLEYARVFLDDHRYDLPGVAMESGAFPPLDFIRYRVEIVETAAANPYIYVDNLIVTQNEP